HEHPRRRAFGIGQAAAGGGHARELRQPGLGGAPVQAIREAVFATRGERRARAPERDDVVGELVAGGQFDQVHLALAPVALRLDPGAGPLLVAALGILEGLEAALALHQPEAARTIVAEAAVFDLGGIAQRPPDLLAGAVE